MYKLASSYMYCSVLLDLHVACTCRRSAGRAMHRCMAGLIGRGPVTATAPDTTAVASRWASKPASQPASQPARERDRARQTIGKQASIHNFRKRLPQNNLCSYVDLYLFRFSWVFFLFYLSFASGCYFLHFVIKADPYPSR